MVWFMLKKNHFGCENGLLEGARTEEKRQVGGFCSGLMIDNDGSELQWWHLIWKEVDLKLFWMY